MTDRDLLIAITLALLAGGKAHGAPDEIVVQAKHFLAALNQPENL